MSKPQKQDSFWRIIQANYTQHEIFLYIQWAAELARLEAEKLRLHD